VFRVRRRDHDRCRELDRRGVCAGVDRVAVDFRADRAARDTDIRDRRGAADCVVGVRDFCADAGGSARARRIQGIRGVATANATDAARSSGDVSATTVVGHARG